MKNRRRAPAVALRTALPVRLGAIVHLGEDAAPRRASLAAIEASFTA